MIHTILISSSQLKLFQTLLSNPSSLTQPQKDELEELSECFSEIITENDPDAENDLAFGSDFDDSEE